MSCNNCAKQLPALRTQAVNVAGAVARATAHAISGGQLKVSPAVEQARLNICYMCPEASPYAKKPEYFRCGKCGCWLNGKFFAKARLASESCPLGKWEAQP
jgi:hypothetical protein